MERLDEKVDKRETLEIRKAKRKKKPVKKDVNRKNKRAKTEIDNTKTEVGDECENSKGKNSTTKSNDQIEMEAEDETNMVFDRSQTWKVDNENIKLDLLQAFELHIRERLHV